MRLTALSLPSVLLLASACSVEPTGPVEPAAASRHALLRVERSSRVGVDGGVTGTAFAGVVQVLDQADPEPLLRLSGKDPSLPALGQCVTTARERAFGPAGQLGRAEFLDAGDVLLGTSGVQTLLAPRAFPSATSDLSGVVYTSRDRASAPLPSGATYLLKTTGSEQLPGFELHVLAPDDLMDVAVAGARLGALPALNTADTLSVTWQAGDARDVVYVEVAGSPEAGSLGVCAFRDSEGRGSLPRGLFGAVGAGSLAFHRLREVAADVPALEGAEVRFDFALTTDVSFR